MFSPHIDAFVAPFCVSECVVRERRESGALSNVVSLNDFLVVYRQRANCGGTVWCVSKTSLPSCSDRKCIPRWEGIFDHARTKAHVILMIIGDNALEVSGLIPRASVPDPGATAGQNENLHRKHNNRSGVSYDRVPKSFSNFVTFFHFCHTYYSRGSRSQSQICWCLLRWAL